MQKIFLWIALLTITTYAGAQTTDEKETKEIYFSVAGMYYSGDSLFALIEGGEKEGITKGLFGKCYNILRKDVKDNYTELASCEVLATDENASYAYVKLYKAGIWEDSLRKGDVIAINVSIPKKAQRSLIYDLAEVNIFFRDINETQLYNVYDLIQHDSKSFEDTIIKRFVDDVRLTYETYKDEFADTSFINQPLTKGRYKGKSIMQVMRDVTPQDIRNFLQFARSYSFSYMGQNYKANATFGTWVMNFALTSSREMKEIILTRRMSDAQLKEFALMYANDIKGDITITLAESAVNLNDDNREVESELLFSGTKKVIDALKDTLGLAGFYLNRAQIYQDDEKYDEAIRNCDLALRYAEQAGSYDYELRSLFKKVYCHYKLSDYKGGKETVDLAEQRLEKYKPLLSNERYLDNLRKRYEYDGWMDYYSGNYEKGLKQFRRAIEINNSVGTYDARFNNASNFWYIGKSYLAQANYKDALNAFDTSLAFYKSINNKYWVGYVTNEIGYTYFKMLEYQKSIDQHLIAYDILMAEKSYNNAGYSKSMIGQNLWNLDKVQEAIVSHTEAIALRRLGDNHEGEAFSWEKLGNLYELSGEKAKALAAFDSASVHYGIIKDSASIAKNFNNIAKVYENDNDYKTALDYYERALKFLRGIESKDGLISTLFNLGMVSFDVDTIKSRQYFTECLQLSVENGDKSNQMYSLINLGALSSNNSEIQQQQSYYERALALSREINTPDMEAYCYSRMGAGYERQLELDKSIEYYRKSMSIYDTVDKKKFVTQMVYAGNVMITKGEYDEAEKTFLAAIDTAQIRNNKLELGDALTSIAFLYILQGEFAKAMAATDSAASIFRETGNKIKLASTYQTWGSLYKGMGEYAKSINSLLIADSIYVAEKKETYRDNVNINIGVTYFFQADYAKALQYFKKVEGNLKNNVVDEHYILIKANIAECYYYLKQPDEAERIMTPVFPVARQKNVNRIGASMAIIFGRIYFDRGKIDEAIKYLQIGVDAGYKSKEKETIVEALMYLGKAKLAQNNVAEAEKHLQEAALITRTYKITGFGWEALYELGLFYYNNNKLDSAIIAFKDAVDIVERASLNVYGGEEAKKMFKASEKKVDLYNKLVATLAKSGNEADAWAYANKSNITAIKELQGSASGNADNPEKTAAINKANSLLQQAAAIDKSISNLEGKTDAAAVGQKQALLEKKAIVEKEYLGYIDQLKKKYPELRLYFAENVNPEEFKKHQSKLPADVAVVLYLINDAQLLIFTVTNEKLGIKIIELKQDINKTLDDFISVLNVPGKASGTGSLTLRSNILNEKKKASGVSFTGTSEALYDLLITSVESEIADKKRICVIPNGKLCNIPFQALGKRMPDSTFSFLVEKYSIFYTNTFDIFLEPENMDKDFSSFVGFGNPDKTLKNAKTEVVEIGKILNTGTVYTEENATEHRAKEALSTKRYVHFATHGVLDYTDFSKSYLVFASSAGTDDDGRLTIDEMKSLSIQNCDFVALSACETAVSQEEQKGWYVSPANALLVNKVKSVVASLWQVDDEATSIVLTEFYKNVRTMSKVDALRKAQESLSHNPKYVHPFFWSAFVLYGDWR